MSPTKCRKSAVCEIADMDYRVDEFQVYLVDTIRWADQLLKLSSGKVHFLHMKYLPIE